VGLSLLWRWRQDDRYAEEIDTTDYGGSLFGRVSVSRPLFFQAEYEYLSYEFIATGFQTARDGTSSVLAGGGIEYPLGGRAFFQVLTLYNFSYDEGDAFSPYDDPWVFRVGVTFGF
jgi:hypothetical protein